MMKKHSVRTAQHWAWLKPRILNIKSGLVFSLILMCAACFNREDSREVKEYALKSPRGGALFVSVRKCNNPSVSKRAIVISGGWSLRDNKLVFDCYGKNKGMITIVGVDEHARSEFLLDSEERNSVLKLIERGGWYERFRRGWGGESQVEILAFRDNYDRQVYARRFLLDPMVLTVYRRLDKNFEISYVMHGADFEPEKIRSQDVEIMEYISNITTR